MKNRSQTRHAISQSHEIQSRPQISPEWLQIDNRQRQQPHHAHLAMAMARGTPTIPISLSTKFQL